MSIGQVGQNQNSCGLSELWAVALYRACLQLSFWRSMEPELEEKQMDHMTGFLLPVNVDSITQGFQRHNNVFKCKHLLLTIYFSPPISYNSYLTVPVAYLKCLQMLSNVQIGYSEGFQEILLCLMQHISGSCHF